MGISEKVAGARSYVHILRLAKAEFPLHLPSRHAPDLHQLDLCNIAVGQGALGFLPFVHSYHRIPHITNIDTLLAVHDIS